jgi:hypothetical protein
MKTSVAPFAPRPVESNGLTLPKISRIRQCPRKVSGGLSERVPGSFQILPTPPAGQSKSEIEMVIGVPRPTPRLPAA